MLESVLRAADVAKIGVAVSLLEPGSSRCVYATDTAASILGVPLDRLVGHSLRDFIVPEDVARLVELAREMIADPAGRGGVVEVAAQRPDGQVTALELAYSPIRVEGKPAVVTFLIPVGEQRATERRARETAQRLAQIIDQAPDAIVISRGGMILEANPAAAAMLGFPSKDQLVGRSLAQFVVGEDGAVMRERTGRIMRGEHPGPPWVYRAKRADGTVLLVEIASFASEYGGQPANIAFGRDVTARERLQEQLARTERLAALGTLAAGVAHEINNPLAALALNVEIVTRAVSRASLSALDKETGATALDELKRSVERMTAVVRDLSGFSRSASEQHGPIDVAGTVERALRVARHATKQRATVAVELDATPAVLGNPGKLEQVLVNLVVNAAQAFPEGRSEAQNQITLRGFRLGTDRAAIEVCDNGTGIPAEVVGRVFDPFFTTKPAGVGTGLGLFICHNLVRQMDGEIVVDSQTGRGTTMRVVLPLAQRASPAATAAPSPAPGARASATRARVLIVDDEPAMCRTLEFLLRGTHEVTSVQGGEEALQRLAASDAWDVVLCDLMMPGVTGMDVHARLAQLRPGAEARMVFMTGGAFTERATTFLAAAPNARLQKPFTAAEVDEAIRLVVEAQGRAGA